MAEGINMRRKSLDNELASKLNDMCEEIIYIEENF